MPADEALSLGLEDDTPDEAEHDDPVEDSPDEPVGEDEDL